MKYNVFLRRMRTPLFVIFSFILGCMFTLNVIPLDRTCGIEDLNKGYHIMKYSKFQYHGLIILILSAPQNVKKRHNIRETWLKLYKTNADYNLFKYYFAVGILGLKTEDKIRLTEEQSIFGDILILPIQDTYQNLTEKLKRSFEWLDEQYNKSIVFNYVLKCDDDSFVNLRRLIPELKYFEEKYFNSEKSIKDISENSNILSVNVQANNKHAKINNFFLYWGYFSGTARIKTKGKWKERDWISSDRYIPYALGGGYVLSKNLISFIAKNSKNLRSFNAEDVSVGLWLAPVNNIIRIHDSRFDTEWVSRGCRNNHLIIHNVSTAEMTEMYNNVIQRNVICTREVIRNSHYIYNWSVPPSQCCKSVDQTLIKLKKRL